METTLVPFLFSFSMVSIISSEYSQSTESDEPKAVLSIFGLSGVAVYPEIIIFSIKKESDVLKIEPTLCMLLILSRITIAEVFFDFLNSSTDFRFSSVFFNFRI